MRLSLFLLSLIFIIISLMFCNKYEIKESSIKVDNDASSLDPITISAAEEKIGKPIKINIPSISMDATITGAGLDKDGLMSISSLGNEASWWMYGIKPGDMGGAVIGGHYKLADGKPGVFFSLNKLHVGESIVVTDEYGAERRFVVSDTKIYKTEEFPTKEIYSASSGNNLFLITCSGVYIKSQQDYSNRLVVLGVLSK